METRIENVSQQETEGSTAKTWRRISLAVRILFGLILFLLILQLVNFSEAVKAFTQAKFEYVLAAILLLGANLGLQIAKWHYFLRLTDDTISAKQATTSLLFGITLGSFTPGQIGELGGRSLRHTGILSAQVIGFTVMDKLQMFLVMALAGIISIVSIFPVASWLQMTIVMIGSLCILALFFRPSLLKQIIEKIPFRILKHEWLKDFLESLTKFGTKELFYSFLMTLAVYAVIGLQLFLLLNAFAAVTAGQAFLGYAAMMFSKALLPISFGDLGIRETTSVYFFSRIGVPETAALNAAFLLFVINMVLPAVIGLFFLPKIKNFRSRP